MGTLAFALSPCPNDTFINYALITGKISLPFQVDPLFADVEVLNRNVIHGFCGVSKISVATLAHCSSEYTLLRTGSAMGIGCGPLLVGRIGVSEKEKKYGKIAIPGVYTTANALLQLYGASQGERIPMLFSDIISSLTQQHLELGVLIHESRFEYKRYGLELVLDLGVFWEERYAMPLPLGVFVIHNSLLEYKEAIEKAMQESLLYAYDHYEETIEYCSDYAQELQSDTLKNHISTFVNEYSLDMTNQGEHAIKTLLKTLQYM